MNKLKAAIQYECVTSFKYVWIFYAVMYAIVALITVVIDVGTGSFEGGVECLETNTIIYVGILGVLGFQEDFKMMIQNGFTRTCIFLATVSMFVFIAAVMAFVDTIVGSTLHYFRNDYSSVYGSIYGYGNLFANWCWLFLFYVTICSFFYLVILVITAIGKKWALVLGIALGCAVLSVTALFQYAVPKTVIEKLLDMGARSMGFMGDGTILRFVPMLTFMGIIVVFAVGAFAVIKRAEI